MKKLLKLSKCLFLLMLAYVVIVTIHKLIPNNIKVHNKTIIPTTLTTAHSRGSSVDDTYKVIRVVDGDTFVVSLGGTETKVRLIGVDTPESVSSDESKNCKYGKISSTYTANLIDRKYVRLEYDESKTDVYGRTLAYVYLDNGEMLNYNLVVNGYAVSKEYVPNTKYSYLFKNAQIEAEKNKKGMWSDDVSKSDCNLKTDYYIHY